MRIKPTYKVISDIDYHKLEYDPNELEPLPEGMEQNHVIFRIFQIIEAHVKRLYSSENVFVDSNTTLCYDPGNLNRRVLPDLYFAFDVDSAAIRRRKLYLPWEAGKPPDFALEVASESTFRNDLGRKRDLYARIGVSEYWRFDPTGGSYYNEPLTGELLLDGVYRPIELTIEPDGILKGYSPALRRSFCWREGTPELYDRETGIYHIDLDQALNERSQAEARIRQLEEELGRRQT